MKKQMMYFSLPLFGNQFKGEVYNICQLSAKFQIWCKDQFDISNRDSLALWVAGDSGETYFGTEENAIKIAKSAYGKLPLQTEVIDIAAVVPDGELSFAVLTITPKK